MSFKTEETPEILILFCPEELDTIEIKQWQTQEKTWLATQSPLVILNFSATKNIDPQFYRLIVLFNQNLKKSGKFLASIGLSESLNKKLSSDGLDSVFSPALSIEDAKKKTGQKTAGKTKVNADFISPFISAVQLTLKVQAQMEVTFEKPMLKSGQKIEDISIAAIISLVSDQFSGSIALCFPKDTFLKVYSQMIGEEISEMSKDTEDAAGEILNIIFGQAKATLNNKHGYTIKTAIPTVLTGTKMNVHNSSVQKAILIPFKSTLGNFYLEVSLE